MLYLFVIFLRSELSGVKDKVALQYQRVQATREPQRTHDPVLQRTAALDQHQYQRAEQQREAWIAGEGYPDYNDTPVTTRVSPAVTMTTRLSPAIATTTRVSPATDGVTPPHTHSQERRSRGVKKEQKKHQALVRPNTCIHSERGQIRSIENHL